jgi:FMN-dependent NADH-azoreductase
MFCAADNLGTIHYPPWESSVSLLRLDASIRSDGSVSREVADTVERSWQAEHPQAQVRRRDIGRDPLPSTAWMTAVGAGRVPTQEHTPEQAEAVALAATLADEMLGADAYLFAVPLYNFGVPST